MSFFSPSMEAVTIIATINGQSGINGNINLKIKEDADVVKFQIGDYTFGKVECTTQQDIDDLKEKIVI